MRNSVDVVVAAEAAKLSSRWATTVGVRGALRSAVIAAFAATGLLTAGVAQAHVTLAPDSAAAGSWTTFAVKVPNESDTASTVKLVLRMPPGVTSASYAPVPGWVVKLTKEKLSTPIKSEEGTVSEVVSEITWTATGGGIEPGQFVPFGLTIPVPEVAGQDLTFKAVQTYDDGKVSRWIGNPESEEPAPTVKVTASVGDHSGDGGEPAGGGSGHDEALTWAALALAAFALMVGIAALVHSGRSGS